jgi:hypothetical protein
MKRQLPHTKKTINSLFETENTITLASETLKMVVSNPQIKFLSCIRRFVQSCCQQRKRRIRGYPTRFNSDTIIIFLQFFFFFFFFFFSFRFKKLLLNLTRLLRNYSQFQWSKIPFFQVHKLFVVSFFFRHCFSHECRLL